MRDEILFPCPGNSAFDNRQSLAEFKKPARTQQISRLGLAQEVDVEICRHRESDRSDMGKMTT